MTELVTIVVPVYNVEDYIEKCVDSLLNQTYHNIEIILVNDGSPDNSGQICEEYLSKDSRVKVINKKNGGLSDARNYGLDKAGGDYIIFLDSDDYVEIDMVEKALEVAREHRVEVVIWGFYIKHVNFEEEDLEVFNNVPPLGVYNQKEMKGINFDRNLINILGYAWNKMYNLKYLRDNNFRFTKGLSLVEDIVFNSPVLAQVNRIAFLDIPLNHYIQRPHETLGTKYYEDHFSIKLQGVFAVYYLLKAWELERFEVMKLKHSLIFNALKSSLRTISLQDELFNLNKKKELNSLISNIYVKEAMNNLPRLNIKDKFIYYIIKSEKVSLILIYYKFANKIRTLERKLCSFQKSK